MKVASILQLVVPTLNELIAQPGISNVTYNPTRDDVTDPWYIRFVAGGLREIVFVEEMEDNYFKPGITKALILLQMCAKLLEDAGFTLRYTWTEKEKKASVDCNVKRVFDQVPGEIEYSQVRGADAESRLGEWQRQTKHYAGIEVGFFAQGSDIVRTENDRKEV